MEGFLRGSQQAEAIYWPSAGVCAAPPGSRAGLSGAHPAAVCGGETKPCPGCRECCKSWGVLVAACKPSAPESDSAPARRKVHVGHFFWGICRPVLLSVASPCLLPGGEGLGIPNKTTFFLSSHPPVLPADCRWQLVWQPQRGNAWHWFYDFNSHQTGCTFMGPDSSQHGNRD